MQFPPFLAASLGITPLPMIQQFTQLLFRRVLATHKNLFQRLGEYDTKRFAFVPTDLALAFVVDPAKPNITVCRKPLTGHVDAGVEGPLFLLLALLEGRCDADALFFARDLVVTGDMEAILAMRNALDDSNIDLPRDLSSMAGPFALTAERLLSRLRQKALDEEVA